jgi:hypothetical protein
MQPEPEGGDTWISLFVEAAEVEPTQAALFQVCNGLPKQILIRFQGASFGAVPARK